MLQKTAAAQQPQRPKPAVPVKPTNIPPIPQQLLKESSNAAAGGATARLNIRLAQTTPSTALTNQKHQQSSTTITPTPTVVDATADNTLPSSPNTGFGNDCCGIMLLPSSSKHHSTTTINNNNNNNNNNLHQQQPKNVPTTAADDSNTGGGGGSSSTSSSSPQALSTSSSSSVGCNKIVQSLNCSNIGTKHHQHQYHQRDQSSCDAVDCLSTLSSSSGGFRDGDFLAKQQIAYVSPKKYHHQQQHSSVPAAITASPVTTTTTTTQKLQFSQTSKQIEQMLAQRLFSTHQQQQQQPSAATTFRPTSSVTPTPPITSTAIATVKKRMSNSYVSPLMEQQQHHQQSSSINNDNSCLTTPPSTTTVPSSSAPSGGGQSMSLAFSKLQQEMRQQCKAIQDKHLIEKRPSQQHYSSASSFDDSMSNRSQPAIGLKQTPKSRPSIFGTVASDHIPKDSINRRGFPQTVASSSTKSIDKNQSKYQSHHSTISAPVTSEQQQPHHHHHQQQAPTITPATATATTHHHQQLENDDNALVYRDGYLISGPLNTLVQHMVPTSDYYPDRSYLFAFLLSARLFIRPHELLAKICQLCDDQQSFSSCWTASTQSNETLIDQHDSIASSSHHPKQSVPDLPNDTTTTSSSSASNNGDCCRKLRSFAQHFVQLLAEWIETFPYDFRDERLMQHVRSMTRKCISIDSALRKDVSTILQNLLQRLTVLEKYEEFLISLSRGGGSGGTADTHLDQSSNERTTKSSVLTIQNNLQSADNSQSSHHYHLHHQSAASQPLTGSLNTSTTTTSSSAATSIDISELCPSPTLLAHQLTHIELERLSYIGPEEFVQAFAKENPHLEQSFSDMKKTRNLESYVQWFNRLSYLVATEIVKHPKKKQRVRIVEYWIETARECFNIGNFNSLMAIIAGLNMSPISRLKKTWAKVQSAKFSVLEHQMDPSSNFNSYRSTLKAAMWRSAGATDERERIVIPFFSLLVKDLYFLNEGCSNKLSNGHINFEKFWQLAKQVTEFIAWKQVTCPFEKLPKVIMFLQTNNVLNENTLAMASFECEPPDNNHEKDRYKSLKSEQQHHSHHHQ